MSARRRRDEEEQPRDRHAVRRSGWQAQGAPWRSKEGQRARGAAQRDPRARVRQREAAAHGRIVDAVLGAEAPDENLPDRLRRPRQRPDDAFKHVRTRPPRGRRARFRQPAAAPRGARLFVSAGVSSARNPALAPEPACSRPVRHLHLVEQQPSPVGRVRKPRCGPSLRPPSPRPRTTPRSGSGSDTCHPHQRSRDAAAPAAARRRPPPPAGRPIKAGRPAAPVLERRAARRLMTTRRPARRFAPAPFPACAPHSSRCAGKDSRAAGAITPGPQNPIKPSGDDAGERAGGVLHPRRRRGVTAVPRSARGSRRCCCTRRQSSGAARIASTASAR